MKSIFWSLLFVPIMVFSQNQDEKVKGFHTHDGFYLSMNIGPAFGEIDLDATGASFQKIKITGSGGAGDVKIGAAVMENLILSFDILVRPITGPKIDVDGFKGSTSDNVTASDLGYGVGVTYYFMPYNIFVNGDLGVSNFTIENKSNNTKYESEFGFAQHVKVGKEWWTGKNWGLGVSAGFGHVAANDKSDPNFPSYKGEFSTNKFFVLFNTTYN